MAVLWRHTMVGGTYLKKLRRLRDVTIQDGVQKIGEQWFMNSAVESVTVPASVREIGKEAFCRC